MTVDLITLRDCSDHEDLAVRLLNRYRDQLYNDREVTPEIHRQFMVNEDRRREYLWIVERDGDPIGMVSVYHIDFHHRKCEWGRFLMEDTGRGSGRIVEFMVLDFVFCTLAMNKLYAEVLADNPRVIDLHRGFGFQVEGTYRDHVWKQGRHRDVVALAMLRADWLAARGPFADRYAAECGRIEIP
jgi:UDP-4-amino-4,6-dideoxy-N-acetyl-beta-L-altrosamine N-acetyltransferase